MWRYRARLPNVLLSILKYLMTCPLVAGSLLVKGAILREVSETVFFLLKTSWRRAVLLVLSHVRR